MLTDPTVLACSTLLFLCVSALIFNHYRRTVCPCPASKSQRLLRWNHGLGAAALVAALLQLIYVLMRSS